MLWVNPKENEYMVENAEDYVVKSTIEALNRTQKLDETIEAHKQSKENPHGVTKAQLGLSNVENTSDRDKPISNAAKAALDGLGSRMDSHEQNHSNPHQISKADVGLSNVPNVATNDQTPTYTEASMLKALASGETLSAAFGKIKRAVREFVEHKGDFGNPHKVTKEQVGLSKVDNTADMDKPVSAAVSQKFGDISKQFEDVSEQIQHVSENKMSFNGTTERKMSTELWCGRSGFYRSFLYKISPGSSVRQTKRIPPSRLIADVDATDDEMEGVLIHLDVFATTDPNHASRGALPLTVMADGIHLPDNIPQGTIYVYGYVQGVPLMPDEALWKEI